MPPSIYPDLHSPMYDDYLTPGLSLLNTGPNSPDLEVFRGNIQLPTFAGSGSSLEEGFFSIHMLHDLKVGTTPTLHVHWSHIIGSPSGDVKWQIEVTAARGYEAGTFPVSTTLSAVQTAGAQYAHHITSDDDMPLPQAIVDILEPDTLLLCRCFRDAGDVEDTFGNDAYLFQVDMHYEVGQLGTTERNRPFTSAGF